MFWNLSKREGKKWWWWANGWDNGILRSTRHGLKSHAFEGWIWYVASNSFKLSIHCFDTYTSNPPIKKISNSRKGGSERLRSQPACVEFILMSYVWNKFLKKSISLFIGCCLCFISNTINVFLFQKLSGIGNIRKLQEICVLELIFKHHSFLLTLQYCLLLSNTSKKRNFEWIYQTI